MAKDDSVLNQTMQAIEEAAVDTSKKVRVGLIGTGWIAEEHMRQFVKFPDAEVVAMADLIPGKAEKFCKRNGIDLSSVHIDLDHASMLAHEHLGGQFSIPAAAASWPHVYKGENAMPERERKKACFRPRPVL